MLFEAVRFATRHKYASTLSIRQSGRKTPLCVINDLIRRSVDSSQSWSVRVPENPQALSLEAIVLLTIGPSIGTCGHPVQPGYQEAKHPVLTILRSLSQKHLFAVYVLG